MPRFLNIVGLFFLTPMISFAQSDFTGRDSISLDEVSIEARRPHNETIPVQRLEGAQLQRLNSQSVADALRYFSGLQIKDYGGVGGIKTVNIRSMGSQHVGVVYDGVQLGNAQNGQIDLGQFSLDNMEEISLYNGQKSEILQPAKDFGSAGSIHLHTRLPLFNNGECRHLRVNLRAGSSDLFNPSLLYERKLSQGLRVSLSGEWLTSSGKYKFRYKRVTPAGDVAYDTTATRENGDINAFRVEANLFGSVEDGEWSAKVYHYESERGIPGAIVNNVWRRGERLWDNNTFAQGAFSLNKRHFSTLNHIKYSYYHTHYINNDEKVQYVDNTYIQHEAYLSTANQWKPNGHLKLSASYDLQWNSMNADIYNFVKPNRLTNMISVASAYNHRYVKFQTAGLMTFVEDKLENRESPKGRRVFTPSAYLSIFPFETRDISVRTFVKRSFRMPTFNDLYYTDMGNALLSPERVNQYDVGFLYAHSDERKFVKNIRFQFDGYYNKVHDKIVAYPKGQQFRWTMINLGLVDIRGLDVSAQCSVSPVRDLSLSLLCQYTYQRAIDVTSPTDRYYRNQIPYIPHNSGSAVLSADWKNWGMNYSFIYVGQRYNQQENILYNFTQPWYTSDVSVFYKFNIRKKVSTKAQIDINNLLSQDYDVILNYPMPKRNFKFTLSFEL